ncbi:hypothetical protein [Nonomuraea turcica]|nr:hypothetical protein [Nonomuraea sp. G32]MDP4505830.1 hypothetical protein [Nonomuraea sp. G32]
MNCLKACLASSPATPAGAPAVQAVINADPEATTEWEREPIEQYAEQAQ